ncbi:uncharacterized protein STEHIDRAFT_124233 [Stereum hirsutum FP-91666 SS1]|uniref:uncharacterized protein n=1 Tax=Stereum hirsutum (strain FP-91666) TaxID=721885 RepID=UPI0004449477|nr:uncharacterized protein STEHIDRAFT_124233 [Stereum hirsutum FP-91666 SS1]EIM82913.1 hypothetical protein STEHIDRAFT_124233 [Stereum hirsutum FP-91666 SS1]
MASASSDPKYKKQKVTVDVLSKPKPSPTKKIGTSKSAALATGEDPQNASEEFPDGSFYCHQCARKKDVKDGLQCTMATAKGRCRGRYCKRCLTNRYGLDMAGIMSDGTASRTKEHVKGTMFIFKCPKCKDACNCRYCRKAKGLPPTGNFNLAAKKAEAAKADSDSDDDKQTTTKAKGKQPEKTPRRSKAEVNKQPKGSTSASATTKPKVSKKSASTATPATNIAAKPKRAYAPKPKPIPQPHWKSVHLPSNFSHSAALARMGVREFVLRFSNLFDMTRPNLEELEEIAGSSVNGRRHAVLDDDEDEEMMTEEECEVSLGWVSEVCVKTIVVGLLHLIAENDAAVGSSQGRKLVLTAAKEANSCGANLSRLWGALASMRSSLSALADPLDTLTFPDPLPPPVLATAHSTRSGKLAGSGVHVATSAQLVYVVEALIEYAIGAGRVKEEMAQVEAQIKELGKEDRERTKEEKDRWEGAKKDADKTDRAQHKVALAAIEQAHRLAVQSYNPRFSPLGIDHDGRIYYALTPSFAEQEATLALLQGDKKKSGKAKGRARITDDDRKVCEKWGWFVAVYGRKPAAEKGAAAETKQKGKKKAEDEDEEGPDDGEEKFWAFWEPEEVRKVAKWIELKNGLDKEEKVKAKGKTSSAKTTDKTAGVSAAKPRPMSPTKPVPVVLVGKAKAGEKGRAGPSTSGTSTKVTSRAASSTVVADTDADGDVDMDSSSKASSPLSDVSDVEDQHKHGHAAEDVDELSELSPASLSEDDDDEESEDEDADEQDAETQMREMMRVDEEGRVLPVRKDLEALVKGLQEYADILEWRISRMVDDEAVVQEKGKGKV